jgi:hypothetical protein
MRQNDNGELGPILGVLDGRNMYAGDIVYCNGDIVAIVCNDAGTLALADAVSGYKIKHPKTISWRPDEPSVASGSVEHLLEQALATYNERNKTYSNVWVRGGDVMSALFSDGITLKTPDEFNRYAKITNIVMKLERYCTAFTVGGHKDSAHDMIVYAAMLESLTSWEERKHNA